MLDALAEMRFEARNCSGSLTTARPEYRQGITGLIVRAFNYFIQIEIQFWTMFDSEEISYSEEKFLNFKLFHTIGISEEIWKSLSKSRRLRNMIVIKLVEIYF